MMPAAGSDANRALIPPGGRAAEREVREPGCAACDRVHRSELGVDQGQDHDHDPGYSPGQDGGTAYRLRGQERAEQPARADDRGLSDAQVAPTSPISRLRPTSVGLVTATAEVSVAMIDPFAGRGPAGLVTPPQARRASRMFG
jgi:hypothetical protein